jgi:tRNA A37 threonylcarbamoyladenosine dehydratase
MPYPSPKVTTAAVPTTTTLPNPFTEQPVTASAAAFSRTALEKNHFLLAMTSPIFPQVSENEGEDDCEILEQEEDGTTGSNQNEFVMEELNTAIPPSLDSEGLSGDDDLHWFRFAGIGRLYEDQDTPEQVVLDRLKSATVAVVGMGGIGSWTAEALSRSGIGNLVLVDLDDICISNTNRQLHTLSTNVGSLKTEVMKERLVGINPYSNITLIHDFVMLDNVEDIMQRFKDLHVDVVIDAIDGQSEKTALIGGCAKHGFPIVTTGSSGGKSDPSQIVCRDLTQVHEDASLVACRNQLATDLIFAVSDDPSSIWNIHAVYSTQGNSNKNNDNNNNLADSFRNEGSGSASFVTGSFGFLAAARVVEMIVRQALVPPKKP